MKTLAFPQGISYDFQSDRFDCAKNIEGIILPYPCSIVVNTSHECNLRCDYCFRRDGKMAPPSSEALNGYLANLPVGQPFRIVLSGGEPFWRKDIYDVIQRCACEPWATIVVTNGTFHIDYKALPKNIRFEFSLDAPNEIIYGSMRGGTPKQYQQLLQNVSDAVSRGYIVRLSRELAVHVVTRSQ